jgi:acetyltransferase-like isoleucine patch superfamily enzyme
MGALACQYRDDAPSSDNSVQFTEYDVLTEKPRIPIRDILLFGLWPSCIKRWIYRLRGYRIGKGVSIGWGSVICGDRVTVGDHTSIGFLTIIRGREIEIGAHVQIGSTTFLDTPYLQIGEGSKINEQVFVGGLQFPDSRFVLGRNCQIMQMSFINPARSIVVGDDSGIGGHCLIFGHNSFLSAFEGYAVDFEPIEIGRSVSLAWGVFVLPKTKIGDGAVVGARSVVQGVIPPRSLAIGFPARVISRAPDFPKDLSDKDKLELFRKIVAEMIQFFKDSGLRSEQEGQRYRVSKPAVDWWRQTGGSWSLEVIDGDVRDAIQRPTFGSIDVLLSLWDIPDDIRQRLQAQGTVWIEIAKKEQSRESNVLGDEIAQFLKRYGVRTFRVPPLSSSRSSM